MREDFLWVEKYRPKTIKDTVLSPELKTLFQTFVDNNNVPNLLLTGSQGIGKTTVAKAMLEELGADYIVINGSDEGRLIDTLRTKIKNFASSVSLAGGRKYVILDEADYCNAETVQPALRNFMEEFSKNCGFIMTCNFVNKIIQPLHSRCSVVEFKIANKDKPSMAKDLYTRILDILKQENISFDEKVIREVLAKHFPDNRRILNELQRYSATGHIDSGILANLSETSIKELMQLLKDKEFTSVRKWVGKNIDGDVAPMFRKIYDTITQYVKPTSIPQVVVTLADYQYKSAFVADQEVNFMAFLTELMVETEWQ
jgi:DNA polymerase III delta prime subunit|tara:strand:- start:1324 stop:2265 length:942 start_codon:yes stop_codon:yes gene_type:complete